MSNNLITEDDLKNAVRWWYDNWIPCGEEDQSYEDINLSCFFKVIERLLIKEELWKGKYSLDKINEAIQEVLSPDHCEPGVIEYSDVTEENQTP